VFIDRVHDRLHAPTFALMARPDHGSNDPLEHASSICNSLPSRYTSQRTRARSHESTSPAATAHESPSTRRRPVVSPGPAPPPESREVGHGIVAPSQDDDVGKLGNSLRIAPLAETSPAHPHRSEKNAPRWAFAGNASSVSTVKIIRSLDLDGIDLKSLITRNQRRTMASLAAGDACAAPG